MAVAFDAFAAQATGVAVNPSWTHTPSGTPRGVIVWVIRATATPLTSVTYGGTSMGSPVASFANSVGGEAAGNTIDMYVLGSSVPTGARTVAINSAGGSVRGVSYTVTAADDVEYVNSASIESLNTSTPSTTLSLSGRTSFVSMFWGSGEDAVTSVSPATGWTSRNEDDLGTVTAGSYSYNTIGSSDVTVTLTQSSDDLLLLAGAVSEVAGTVHDLLANDVESDSEVTTPAIGQVHGLLANDVQSTSSVTSPSLGQVHALAATSVESSSNVTTPALVEVVPLTADDVESASEVSTPALGQIHALAADDVQSSSSVTIPAIGQIHALAADDVESSSEVTAPALGVVHNLLADDLESASEVSAPAVGQIHGLLANDVESASEVTSPVLGVDGVNNLLADDVQATSEVSSPTLGQVHVLSGVSIQSLSEVSIPALNGATGEVAEDRPAGGWGFLNTYNAEQQRRRARERRRKQLEEESERIEDQVSREIAQLLRKQEAEDDRRQELQRLGELARASADIEAARQYSERVATAYARALAKGNYSALEALERELRRAAEEEEWLVNATMALLN